jgi:hypothetical protein
VISNMTKKIKFNPISKIAGLTVPPPQPAAGYIPKWFKNMAGFNPSDPPFCPNNGNVLMTAKQCMPFLDSLQMGYIQETWQDIWIKDLDDGRKHVFAPELPMIMNCRYNNVNKELPHFENFRPENFSWHPPWWPELPPGYSCIITHPFNHDHLPFRTYTGIVDCDSFGAIAPQSNIPFKLNENFTGMIKKGTPMYMIIPYKRDDWESIVNSYDEDQQIAISKKIRQYLWNGYKKIHWTKKRFK